MRDFTLLIFAAACQLTANAHASDNKLHELNQWNSLQARYKIHSGGTASSQPPTNTDSAVTIAFKDEATKRVFEQIGPDVEPLCSSEKGDRLREKKGVYCSYTARLENSKSSHYRCWIGINLRTGEGDVRVSC